MSIKKIGALVATAALSASLFAGSAMADTTIPPLPSTTTTLPAASLSQDFLANLKAKMDTIVNLRLQHAGLEAQIKAQHETNMGLYQQLHTKTETDLVNQIKDARAHLKTEMDTTVKPLRGQEKGLADQYKQAKANKDDAQMVVLRVELQDVRTQIKTALRKLQGERDQIKVLVDQLRARRAAVKAILAQRQPLFDQEKAVWAEIHRFRIEQDATWKTFDAAMKAVDQNGMLSSLDIIISRKQSIASDLPKILAAKVEVAVIIQNAISAYN